MGILGWIRYRCILVDHYLDFSQHLWGYRRIEGMESLASHDLLEKELRSSVRWARALALALVHDGDEADDLVQETWTTAVRHRPSLREPLRPWLGTVLRHLAATSYRLGLRRRKREERVEELRVPTESAEDHLLQVENMARLGRFLKELDEPYRQTLVMRFLEERSSRQIACTMEIPEGTVRWRIKEGLARLRKRMDDEHEGERNRWRRALLPWLPAERKPPGLFPVGRRTVFALASAFALVALWVSFRGRVPELKSHSRFSQKTTLASQPTQGSANRDVSLPRGPKTTALAPSPLQEIRGCITEAGGGPIPGAEIQIIPSYGTFGATKHTRAQEDGCYGLHITPGHFIFLVKASGYASEAGTLHKTQELIRELNQTLLPGATIFGKVLAGDGKPAMGVEVSAYVSGNFGEQLIETSQSRENGEFEIRDLRAGATRIEAHLGEWVGTTLVTTTSGERMGSPDLVLRLGVTVGGVVLGPDLLPVVKAHLWLRSEVGLHTLIRPQARETYADGLFVMKGLIAGQYLLTAQAPGYLTLRRSLNLSAEGHSQTIKLVLQRLDAGQGREMRGFASEHAPDSSTPVQGKTAWLHGLVRWTDGSPAPSMGLDVFAANEVDNFRFVKADGEGRFRLGPFHPGPVRVTATRRASGELDTRFSSPIMTFLLKANENRGPVELRIPLVGAPIAGRVRTSEGNPIPGAEVRSNFCFDGRCLHYSKVLAVTGGDGRFRVEDLPQSKGTLFIHHPAYAESVSDPVASGDTSLEIVLHPGISLSGMVRHQGTASEAKVSLFIHESYPVASGLGKTVPSSPTLVHATRHLMQETSRVSGGFTFQRIRPGNYTVLAQSATGLVGVSKEIEWNGGQPMSQVMIDLDDGATASGQIMEFGSRKPIQNIRLSALAYGQRPAVAEATTNEAGQFTLTGLPLGVKLMIQSQSMGRFIDENSTVQFKEKGPNSLSPIVLLRADQWERSEGIGTNHGIFFGFDSGIPTVQYVKVDSAADRAGLKKGDRLWKINGTMVDGLLRQGIQTLLSGAPGTTANLHVYRKGSEVATEIAFVRR